MKKFKSFLTATMGFVWVFAFILLVFVIGCAFVKFGIHLFHWIF